MYSWKLIRTCCAILLLVPIAHLSYLVAAETLDALDSSPETWSDELQAIVQEDQRSQLPLEPIVVTGGRRAILWPGLEQMLAPMNVLMRGLGDATVNDISYHYERLIGFYAPVAVVVFPGESEFHIRDSKSAEELLDAVKALVTLDEVHGVGSHYYVLAPLKTPLYETSNALIEDSGAALSQWAAQQDHVTVIDMNRYLANERGVARPEFFRNDGMHLNELGYAHLSIALRNTMEEDFPHYFGLAEAP